MSSTHLWILNEKCRLRNERVYGLVPKPPTTKTDDIIRHSRRQTIVWRTRFRCEETYGGPIILNLFDVERSHI